ncbi:unnamed protein product, partial [Closterium sp. NIES-53]
TSALLSPCAHPILLHPLYLPTPPACILPRCSEGHPTVGVCSPGPIPWQELWSVWGQRMGLDLGVRSMRCGGQSSWGWELGRGL